MKKFYWSSTHEELLNDVKSSPNGLSSKEAAARLKEIGPNKLSHKQRSQGWRLLWDQFKSPLTLLLIIAALLSYILYQKIDGTIIIGIVLATVLLGFYQEKGAFNAVQKLLKKVETTARVLRDGKWIIIGQEKIVPGDIVSLSAGELVPGDGRILDSKDLFVNEASFTGESFGVEKAPGMVLETSPLSERTNSVLMGSYVISGHATVVIVATGSSTVFGTLAEHLKSKIPETAFEHGLREFGYFLMEVTFCLVLLIFIFNQWVHHPILESFLFALALAVGLTPQLLPAIVSINLSKGARRMALDKVIVKKLSSIENFGSMNVLCVDKTGTLTEGAPEVETAVDQQGDFSEEVLKFASVNAQFQTGYTNPIDTALCSAIPLEAGWKKLDEVPYDFTRKRVSILAEKEGSYWMIIKGAFETVAAICNDPAMEELRATFKTYAEKGFRLLAVAAKKTDLSLMQASDETALDFLGFIVFKDPLKKDAVAALENLRAQNIQVKMITGDQHQVALHVAQQVKLGGECLIGSDLRSLSDEALIIKAKEVNVFAEIEPAQKERIILALRRGGATVGYLGDGINDSTALHAADVSISVDSGSDVAKDVSDIILLEKDLTVLSKGVSEGRKTFANTMKYIFMATSANFGNMFSMAGASLILPFLPLLPKQILLTNLLTDFPEMAIATDSVDPEWSDRPVRWDISRIKRFMLIFGLISSIFDYATFGVLLYLLKASPEQFRTGWFIESVASAALIVLIIRTRRPFWKSRPSFYLTYATFLVILLSALLPYLPIRALFSFAPLPLYYFGVMAALLAAYIVAAEVAKKVFYAKYRDAR